MFSSPLKPLTCDCGGVLRSGGSAVAGEAGTLPLGSVISNVRLSRAALGSHFVTRNLEKGGCNESSLRTKPRPEHH